nr:SRPBCC domain-containing protein [Octadecabacter arcticus]
MNASPATVWCCWTDPELLATWFAPDPVKVATFEVDPTSSGLFNVIMQMPGHDPTVAPAGCVLVAYKDARLV